MHTIPTVIKDACDFGAFLPKEKYDPQICCQDNNFVIICILYDAGRFCVSSFKCCLGKSRPVAEDKTRNLRKIILEGPGGIIISQYTILLHH